MFHSKLTSIYSNRTYFTHIATIIYFTHIISIKPKICKKEGNSSCRYEYLLILNYMSKVIQLLRRDNLIICSQHHMSHPFKLKNIITYIFGRLSCIFTNGKDMMHIWNYENSPHNVKIMVYILSGIKFYVLCVAEKGKY